jgi:hypothetical protein
MAIRGTCAAAHATPASSRQGRCGPHIFRHARAVELLRAERCRKRSSATCSGIDQPKSTNSYLKLATEDLQRGRTRRAGNGGAVMSNMARSPTTALLIARYLASASGLRSPNSRTYYQARRSAASRM